MKVLVCILFAVLAVEAQVEEITEINWSNIKPIGELNNSNGNRRIFDGKAASKSQFPYQAGLIMTIAESQYLGGGSLISSNRVLTAAHCVKDISYVLVILGAQLLRQDESTQVRIYVRPSGVVSHPQYDPETNQNDIAMIKLPSAVTFNDAISPIAFAEGINDFVGDTGVMSGWGFFDKTNKQSMFLRFADVKVITNSECSNKFEYIIDSTICAKGQGSAGGCDGDSG